MRFFNRVTLQTPESVELEFVLAGIGNRAFALLIDYHILGLILVGFAILWSIFSFYLLDYLGRLGINYSSAPTWLLAIAILTLFILFTGYFVFFETIWQGQTPGKRFVKIRVIRDDGRPVRLPQAILRAILRPVDDILSLGVWLIIFGKQEKRLGDWVAGTLVIQNERPVAANSLIISEDAHTVAKQLLETAHLELFMPDDFAVVRDYLQRRSLIDPSAKSTLSLQLARQAKEIIALESLPTDMTPDVFLEAVYLAYQEQSPRTYS
jgi:uncharacterized RDD family membrane protein YckC